MIKEEKILDQILVFMKDEVSKNGSQLHAVSFNFRPFYTLAYFNAPDAIIPDGEDLITFKKVLKPKQHELIIPALNLAISEGFVKDRTNEKYSALILTEKGFARAKSFQANQNVAWRIRWKYFLDKVCIPLIVAITITIITNYLNQKGIDDKIKILKMEIEWIKKQK